MTLSDFGILGEFATLFTYLSEFFYGFYTQLFERTVGDVVFSALDIPNVPDSIMNFGLFDIPFGTFILGSGLSLYVAYQFIKYVLDIIF